MDKLQHQEIRDKDVEPSQQPSSSSAGNAAAASPPSASSSPSHEFSFTISLHQSSAKAPDRTKPQTPSFAVDLTPADEIFFHGHLLPLHLLSNLPVSPLSSTNSLGSFTLPIKELVQDQNTQPNPENQTTNHDHDQKNIINDDRRTTDEGKSKSRSLFPLFWLPKWRKGYQVRDKEEKEKHWRKLKYDVTQVVKRYMRMVRPILSFRGGRRGNLQFDRQTYSYSGHLSLRGKKDIRGRRGEYSAPASMRTSPTNSGLLVQPATSPTSSSDSTMEELQAAIQAAIAHCKKSIAMEDQLKCQED